MEEHSLSDVLLYGHELAWQTVLYIAGELPFDLKARCLLVKPHELDIPPDYQVALSISEVQDVILNARTQVVDITPEQLLAAFNYYCLHEDFLRFE